jgi:hypothetical protein
MIVLRQPQRMIDPLIFAPLHQLLPAEPESPRNVIFIQQARDQASRMCFIVNSLRFLIPISPLLAPESRIINPGVYCLAYLFPFVTKQGVRRVIA